MPARSCKLSTKRRTSSTTFLPSFDFLTGHSDSRCQRSQHRILHGGHPRMHRWICTAEAADTSCTTHQPPISHHQSKEMTRRSFRFCTITQIHFAHPAAPMSTSQPHQKMSKPFCRSPPRGLKPLVVKGTEGVSPNFLDLKARIGVARLADPHPNPTLQPASTAPTIEKLYQSESVSSSDSAQSGAPSTSVSAKQSSISSVDQTPLTGRVRKFSLSGAMHRLSRPKKGESVTYPARQKDANAGKGHLISRMRSLCGRQG